MAVYKVPQDVEADDHILGPLSLKQFIFAAIFIASLVMMWFLGMRVNILLAVPFLPVAVISGFLAAPMNRQQPNEVWLAAMIHYYFKPRRRIWDQSGQSELVKITAPKKDETPLTDGLNQQQVESRLKLLASVLDSRGWAAKNVNLQQYDNMHMSRSMVSVSPDRLVQEGELPKEVSDVALSESDDLASEFSPVGRHFDELIRNEQIKQRQDLQLRMQRAAEEGYPKEPIFNPPKVQSFPQDEMLPDVPAPNPARLYATTTIHDPVQVSAQTPTPTPIAQNDPLIAQDADTQPTQTVTNQPSPAIINLALSSDLSVETLSREAKKAKSEDFFDENQVINLH